mgnify:CR=1 FL=1
MLEKILEYNSEFLEKKGYEKFIAGKYPNKKVAIISCMDTRLTELLPAAMGLKNGDAKIIKNAGGVVSHPFGSVMRSLLICIYELDVEEILVVGHTDCGARFTDSCKMLEKMRERGIPNENIKLLKACGVDFKKWLRGFDDLEFSVGKSVEMIRNHPLVPDYVRVYGLVMDSVTGGLERIL